jgi:micrococcal nuclease
VQLRSFTLLGLLGGAASLGCAAPADEPERCGPSEAVVERVIDGDTVVLESGERVRYLLIDTPEDTSTKECWGAEATQANRDLVEGRLVRLHYDLECEDRYGRLLAYIERSGQIINRVLVERGHACVLQIPPNGQEFVDEYRSLEEAARQLNRGLWAVCDPVPCR